MRLTEDELHDALSDERPSIDAEFAAMLDERAAHGFPRERSSRWAELADRLRAVPPRRLLAPAGAVATLLVVAGVSVTTLGGSGRDGRSRDATTTSLAKLVGRCGPRAGRWWLRDPRAPPASVPLDRAQGELSLPQAAARASQERKVASTADLTLSTDPDECPRGRRAR